MKLIVPHNAGTRKETAARTRATLIDTGVELFTRDGYAAVSTVQICECVGVTRGAFYHHFANKTELMEACFERIDHQLVERLSAHTVTEPRDRIRATCREFVNELADPRVRQILFVEAPAALGWARWRELDGGRSLALVRGQLAAAADSGHLGGHDPRVLAHLLLGALNELGMLVAASASPERAMARVRRELDAVLDDLLTR